MLDTTNISEDSNPSNSLLMSMQIQLGEIKGILNTIVTEHARRLSDQESNARQLRNDLDAVKSEAKKDVVDLSNKINDIISNAKEAGNKNLATVTENIVTNKNHISEIRTDVQEIRDKANGSWQRVTGILALIVAAGSVFWQVLGKG